MRGLSGEQDAQLPMAAAAIAGMREQSSDADATLPGMPAPVRKPKTCAYHVHIAHFIDAHMRQLRYAQAGPGQPSEAQRMQDVLLGVQVPEAAGSDVCWETHAACAGS